MDNVDLTAKLIVDRSDGVHYPHFVVTEVSHVISGPATLTLNGEKGGDCKRTRTGPTNFGFMDPISMAVDSRVMKILNDMGTSDVIKAGCVAAQVSS